MNLRFHQICIKKMVGGRSSLDRIQRKASGKIREILTPHNLKSCSSDLNDQMTLTDDADVKQVLGITHVTKEI